jgi:hypothetical protein
MLTGIVAACISAAALGCDHRQSPAERLERAYQESGLKPVATYPLAGRVMVDNQAAVQSPQSRLVVVAYNTAKPHAPARQSPFVIIRPDDGSFEFKGLPPGEYVMLFAQLGYLEQTRGFYGTDALHNLYNDPDVNGKKPQFVIEHQAPGKTDYEFDLAVAGERPPAAPGAKALVGGDPRGRASRVPHPRG